MGKCTNAIGIILGSLALALSITAAIMEWLPADENLRAVLKEIAKIKLWSLWMPVISSCILGLTLLLLLIDMKADKILFRVVAILGFLGAGICIAYGASMYVKYLVLVAQEVESNPENTAAWSDLSNEEMNEILDGLAIDSWSEGFDMVRSWRDLGLRWGWAVAFCSAFVDVCCMLFYGCISCCGLA